MFRLFQLLVFLILQILFIPFTIIGIILCIYKEMSISKKIGVSFTAGQAIQPLWVLHYFGTRTDEALVKFIRHLPIESHIGLLGLFGASLIANRICGFKASLAKIPESGNETLNTYINTRAVQFDRIFEKYANHVDQIVIMGAGYDLRPLKYTKDKNVKVFELDLEKTQNLKLATMKKAGLQYDWITYIPIDFKEESWVEKLTRNGFDKTKKTYFHWETVSMYLNEEVVKDTLHKMSELCSQGSIIAQDFYSKTFIKRNLKILVEKMGEPWIFGIDMSDDVKVSVESILKESGFVLKKLAPVGHKCKTGKPFYVVAECEKR